MSGKKKQEMYHPSALSIDVEDGVSIFMRDLFRVDMPPTDRVVKNVNVLLDLFQQHQVNSTMFILGEVAAEYPFLVKKMAEAGHELGVHGFHHDQIFKMSPEKTRESLYRAKSLLEDLTGQQVFGFRAPAFSVFEKTRWALDIIADLGFKYDSSIVPVQANRYGWPGISKEIHRLRLSNEKSLIEVPLSVTTLMGKPVPACGGGYLRYFPYWVTRKAFKEISMQRPVIVYLHPYELDTLKYPQFFYDHLKALSLRKRLPLYLYRFNKGTVYPKLSNLMKEFQFKPIIDIIRDLEDRSGLHEHSLCEELTCP